MKCLFVYNPNSGKSGLQKRIDYIKSQLNTIYDEVDYKPTEYKGHAQKIASDACGKYDYLVISGGDGTVNEVVNGLAEKEHAPILGYLPSGTVNDLSRSLMIPRNLKKAIAILRQNSIYHHDIFKANDKYGIYFCGSGVFTSVSYSTKQKKKKKLGKIAYFIDAIKDFSNINDFEVDIITKDGKVIGDKYIMLLIINSRSTAGFLSNKKANLSDGKVDLVFIKRENDRPFNYLKSLFNVARVFLFGINSVRKSHDVTLLNLDEFDLKISKRLIINIDGEEGTQGNIHFTVLKQHLNIIVNPKVIKKIAKYEKKRAK